MRPPKLKEDYILARCCNPSDEDEICGYYSHDNFLKVHRVDCPNLVKADAARLVKLNWKDILAEEAFTPAEDYHTLDATDFAILKHHQDYDIDYSLMVAKVLALPRQEAFDRHAKLKRLALLERVDALMVQYRKKVVDHKWIKHRNHTYYRLTRKGRQYLEYYLAKHG